MTKDLITRFCLASFKAEMELAAVPPPKGMGFYTCKCFRTKLEQGFSIDSAKSTCKNKAIKEFSL